MKGWIKLDDFTFEPLAEHLRLCITRTHKFGTDAFLLSDFAAPRRRDTVCDLGSGCGIIPALWFRKPEDAPRQVYAVEVQELAVAQMKRSLEAGGLPASRFFPVHADLRQLKGRFECGSFDLVTCNPPYKAAGGGILSESDADRIARHETLCSFGDVCDAARYLLKFGGRLCVCQRPERLADLIDEMRRREIEPKRLRFVHQRPDAPPWLLLLEGRRGGKPFLRVDPPLLIEGENGFSQEVLRIYNRSG